MKKIIFIMLAALLLLGGCASQKAYDGYRASFDAAADSYYKAAKEPLVDIVLPAPGNGGKEYHVVVNREIKQLTPSQIKDSEWVTPVAAAVGVAGGVANNYVSSHYSSKNMKYITGAIGGGVNTAGGDAYITDSYNKQSVVSAGDATATQGGGSGGGGEEVEEEETEWQCDGCSVESYKNGDCTCE